jgi:hypothetical protein
VNPPNPVLFFASYHAYLDHASGAALATRDLFEHLTARGWSCRVVCGPHLSYEDRRTPRAVLERHQIPHHIEWCAPPNGVPLPESLSFENAETGREIHRARIPPATLS